MLLHKIVMESANEKYAQKKLKQGRFTPYTAPEEMRMPSDQIASLCEALCEQINLELIDREDI